MSGTAHRVIELHVGGRCELSCAVCDCHSRPSDPDWARRTAQAGGARLTCRGGTTSSDLTRELLGLAADANVEERQVRTHALPFANPEAARALAAQGATAVLVPLFSANPAVHDRIAGRPGALSQALAGMRALAAQGLAVDVEIPFLSGRLQDLEALLDLARRAVPVRRARFFVPRMKVPAALAPPAWDEGGPRLAAAIRKALALGIAVEPALPDALPLCALRADPELLRLFRTRGDAPAGCAPAEACASCAVRDRCPTVAAGYRAAHGEAGLVAFSKKPAELADRAPNPHARWTPERIEGARRARMLVLRPTVNCNQDCAFCSANETSGNVWASRDAMLRAIARAGRRGVKWLSFSGGEPTLSKDLVSYVRAASRVGIDNVEIITNGVLLDRLDRVENLRRAGLTHAFVSLHAHDEELSRRMTQKSGDFPRTVAAVGHLLESFVQVTLNHVITSRNYRYLQRFVEFAHAKWGGRAWISFAFVTPQYKALENIDLVPRLSEVMPHLRRAMHRALELQQPVTIGVRQGIPPCQLGEFQAWSDLFQRASESAAEDAPQKQRGAACETCRYGSVCPGLWKPYAARFGTGELRSIPGPPIDLSKLQEGRKALFSFDVVPEHLRDRAAEAEGRESLRAAPEAAERVMLPVFVESRTRPARVALFGSGTRARELARALRRVEGLSLDAVVSPHAPDGDLADFGHCPAFRDPAEALDAMRPEAVVIAAATEAHAALARLAIDANLPVLLEKPLAATEAEAEALARAGTILPVHALRFAEGLEIPRDFARLTLEHRLPTLAPHSPRAWGRAAVAHLLYELLSLAPGPWQAVDASFRGDSRPERARVVLAAEGRELTLSLDFTASADAIVVDGRPAPRRRTHELDRLLQHFRDVALGRAEPKIAANEAVSTMRAVRAALDALARAGAPFERPDAPTHVASRPFREAFP